MDMPKAKTPEERTTKKYKTPDDFLAGPRGPPPDDDPTLYMDENGVDVRTLHEDWDHSTGWWVKPWDTVMREVKRINALEKRRAIFVIRSGEREDYKWFVMLRSPTSALTPPRIARAPRRRAQPPPLGGGGLRSKVGRPPMLYERAAGPSPQWHVPQL